MISASWAVYLLLSALWTTFFSLLTPPLRGFRNLGILAAYLLFVPMVFGIGWRSALATWALLGIGGGLLYASYELLTYVRRREPGARPRAGVLMHGIFLWPILVPEAIEYALADLRVLRAAPAAELSQE